jgi:hypothetical protein
MLSNDLVNRNVAGEPQELVIIFEDATILNPKYNKMLNFFNIFESIKGDWTWTINSTTSLHELNELVENAWMEYQRWTKALQLEAQTSHTGSKKETTTRLFYFQLSEILSMIRGMNSWLASKNAFNVKLVNKDQFRLANTPSEVQKQFFWIVDTDGLDCRPHHLNIAEKCTVPPIDYFVKLKLSGVDYGKSDEMVNYLKFQANNNPVSTQFVLWVKPNFEVYEYDTSNFDSAKIEDGKWNLKLASLYSTREDTRIKAKQEDGVRYILEQENLNRTDCLLSKTVFERFYVEGIETSEDYDIRKKDVIWNPSNDALLKSTISTSIYFAKKRSAWDEIRGTWAAKSATIPFPRRNGSLTREEAMKDIDPMRLDLFSNEFSGNNVSLSWAPLNRCNAPTEDRLNKETSQRFGQGYNGKKPCERMVMSEEHFCWLHDPSRPRCGSQTKVSNKSCNNPVSTSGDRCWRHAFKPI